MLHIASVPFTCFLVLLSTFKCFIVLPSTSLCFLVLPSASYSSCSLRSSPKCFPVLPSTFQCFQMFPIASQSFLPSFLVLHSFLTCFLVVTLLTFTKVYSNSILSAQCCMVLYFQKLEKKFNSRKSYTIGHKMTPHPKLH